MPRKGSTPRAASGTPRDHSGKKNNHVHTKTDKDNVKKIVVDYEAEGREAGMKMKSKNITGLSIKEQKEYQKGYAKGLKKKRLEQQREKREAKKQANLEEMEKNAHYEGILRQMCDEEGIKELVERKYNNMVLFITTILRNKIKSGEEGEGRIANNILKTFEHTSKLHTKLSKEYKKVVNLYVHEVKKLYPFVRGVKPDETFEKWIKTMKEDSENIIQKRNDLYMSTDFEANLNNVDATLQPEDIDAIKKLCQKKLEADAFANLDKIARQSKKERLAEARAKKLSMSGDTSLASSTHTSPREATVDPIWPSRERPLLANPSKI